MAERLYDLAGKRIYVAGHRGMVGSAIVRKLSDRHCEVLTATRSEVDLIRQSDVEDWFDANRPDAVFVAAARVGGILANNSFPADFLYDNLMIEANIIKAAHATGVGKLMFLGSSCIYPKLAEQPMREDALLTGPLEPTNEWYAVAKIAGIKLAQAYRKQHGCDFISAMPTNLYGPGDNYNLETSHVLPALIRKVVEARDNGADEITMWGTGQPLREFMHADDLAGALIFLMEHYSDAPHVNVGSGQEISIRGLADLVVEKAGFRGRIVQDETKPDGTPRKLMDSSLLHGLGWKAQISLAEGVASSIREFEALQAKQSEGRM
ncbi:MAG: GDP-L-fucose synthase [Pseudomonadota bacterium]